ncbi:MAG: hypothetical protein V3T72_06100 [Thermoanaerobaculia bacterium]
MRPESKKGTFSDLELPVAKKYLTPARRRGLLGLGGIAAALILAVAAWDFFGRRGELFAAGPLSSNHATFADDCASCHQPFGEVASDRCSVCHEKYGDELGVYTFVAHYIYRSNDFQRSTTSDHETACAGCHLEHLGREAEITRVSDARCLPCHDFGSFNRDHPQFEFAAADLPDDAGLAFTHVHHVREVMQRQELIDVERACLHCHNAQSDGKSFQPIDFDRHCDACHLTATEKTPRLPLREPGETAAGVLALAAFQESGGAAARWAFYTDPNEYRQLGRGVSKSPLHHEDRWIMENLRALRRMLYPDAGLADLLLASAEVPAGETRVLYREALATLREAAAGLRGRPEPEIQQELDRIEQLLRDLERALEDPYTPLDETDFFLALERPDPGLGGELVAEIETLVADLTESCRRCHTVDKATFARVQKDQRVLRRAEFDHRAHILQVRCLECHGEIPILERLDVEEKTDAADDRAEIQNLPRIETCRTCHEPRQASNRCVTCHYFHPNKDRRSELLLYLDTDEGRNRVREEQTSKTFLQGG